MSSRAERTFIGDWLWTVDRLLIAALLALMVAGVVLLMGGGPPVAERLGLPTFYFVNRQVLYLIPTLAIMGAVSFLSLRHVRRLALFIWASSVALCILALNYGPEIKGRASLDPDRGVRTAALGVREACLRGARRLGVLGRSAAARYAGRHPGCCSCR